MDVYIGTPARPFLTWQKEPSQVRDKLWNYGEFKPKARSGLGRDGRFYKPFYPDNPMPFILAVYKISPNNVLGIVHLEQTSDRLPANNKRIYSIGIAYSSTNGDTWIYCGDILKPQAQSDTGSNACAFNIYGGGYILNKTNDSLYVYFVDCPTGTKAGYYGRNCVARANLANVIRSAASGAHTVQKDDWKKYNVEKNPANPWSEDPFTGIGSQVFPHYPGDSVVYNFHCHATYCKPLKKYLHLAGLRYNKLLLFSSTNGVDWDFPPLIADSTANVIHEYASFSAPASDTVAADDFHEVGRSFFIMYPQAPREDPYNDALFYRKVSVVKQ